MPVLAVAAALVASPSRKPTVTMTSHLAAANELRFGT
jgi:hypothetical protein